MVAPTGGRPSKKGMYDGAKEFGAQVEMRRSEGEPAQQIQRIEDVISLPDVQGVAISVLEAESPGIADKMRELQAAGKIVIAIDSDGQKDARRAYIGTFNRKAGEVAGKAAKTLRPQGGKTVAFVGTAAAANASERRQGFFAGAGDAFRVSSKQDALEVFEDGTDKTRAQSNVQTAISKYPDAGVYLGLWSYNAHFIAEEIAKVPDLRKKVTIVTFDLDEAAVDDLAEGRDRRDRLPEPLPDGLPGRAPAQGVHRQGPEDDRRDAPGGHRQHRYRRPRDRAQQRLAREGRRT